MNNALMNAILSMDAYNRGYGAGLIFGSNPGKIIIHSIPKIRNWVWQPLLLTHR
jgi:hypothetical protein